MRGADPLHTAQVHGIGGRAPPFISKVGRKVGRKCEEEGGERLDLCFEHLSATVIGGMRRLEACALGA